MEAVSNPSLQASINQNDSQRLTEIHNNTILGMLRKSAVSCHLLYGERLEYRHVRP